MVQTSIFLRFSHCSNVQNSPVQHVTAANDRVTTNLQYVGALLTNAEREGRLILLQSSSSVWLAMNVKTAILLLSALLFLRVLYQLSLPTSGTRNSRPVKKSPTQLHTMGIEKEILKEGTGPKPRPGQTVTVHCTGFGKKFLSLFLTVCLFVRLSLLSCTRKSHSCRAAAAAAREVEKWRTWCSDFGSMWRAFQLHFGPLLSAWPLRGWL